MKPTLIVAAAVCAAASLGLEAQPRRAAPPSRTGTAFRLIEATVPDMTAAMAAGRVTSREIVRAYLVRLGMYEDLLHAAITVNPQALELATERDRERAAGRVRGPLHGVPIALKDNIHTTFMRTTGGALAFERLVPPYDATLTQHLVDAGAVIIAKTGMTELANWIAGAPTPMPTGYNPVGGQGFNPYDPRKDLREATFDGRPALATGGSSSGIGTAANLWAANVGTETSGSILSPANQTMLAAVKPTVGRISRYGVIPITADQDTPGPMGRHVVDVAVMLGVLEGRAPDPRDPATSRCRPPAGHDYTVFLKRGALKGARVGIPRAFFYEPLTLPGEQKPRGGVNDAQRALMQEAITVLRREGAVVVDPADVPSVTERDPAANFLLWGTCSGADEGRGHDDRCSTVFKYGMKRDFNAWLESLGPAAPLRSLSDLIAWNAAHAKAGALKYGQSNLVLSDEMDLRRDRARYEADRAKDVRLAGAHGIDEVMRAQRLDALLFPGSTGASIAAKPGYPTVIVPAGMVPNAPTPPFPTGFDARPAPMGVSFTGSACSEPTLLGLAYAFEQATHARVAPDSAP